MARTVIDELIVRLGLDPKNFTKGQREAVDALKKTQQQAGETDKTIRTGHAKTTRAMRDTGQVAARVAKGLEAHGKQGAEFFDQITRSGLKLLGIITAGRAFADFAKDTIVTAAAQGRLASNLGISTKALTQWGAAVKQYAGGNASAAEGSMGGLLQSYQVFKATGKPDERMMVLSRYLGLPISDLRPGKFSTLIGDLAAKMHAMPKPEAYAVGHMLGFDEGSINLLEQGRKAVEAHFQAVAKEGTITGRQAKAMQQLQTAMAGVETASSALGRELMTDAAPAISHFADHITRLLELMGGAKLTPQEKKLKHAMRPSGWANTPEGHFLQHLFEGKNAPLTSKQKAVRAQIMDSLIAGGMSPVNAAASAGNAMGESSYKPDTRTYDPKSGYHYGLWQVSEDWRKKILAATGIDMWHASAARQAKGYLWALHHDPFHTLSKIKGSKSANKSAQIIDKSFERSGDDARKRAQRGAWANAALASYRPQLPPSVATVLHALRANQAHTVNHTVNHNQSETHIGAINVQTGATDGHGVVKAIQGAARNRGLAVQANGGLS